MLASDLSQEQRRNALASINIIKENQGGGIKGRSVADGRKQKSFYNKYDITSPTVSTYALLITSMIDAWEWRAVGASDVPGAYLRADMEDFVILRMVGAPVDVLCKVNREHEQFVTEEIGKEVINLQLKKALYG